MQLNIVIINYNSKGHLKNCLESICRNNCLADKVRIIVYDNGSTDNSLAHARRVYPKVQYMGNHTNLGFARAVNNVIGNTKSEYILLLNLGVVILSYAMLIIPSYSITKISPVKAIRFE